jgi:pyruvate/2-oxoglutarate dehydrogenase complex dihydrolipoamide dehydrogenase (E3) component
MTPPMSATLTPDICVIGAGSAGLSVAAGAAQLGADTLLIEADKMGGDCLNYGCVPSKALLAAAHAAEAVRRAQRFGIRAQEPEIEFAAVHAHVHGVIAAIAPHDSEERFAGLGVRVIRARACFTGPRELVAGGLRISARRFVIATGSRPLVPPIPGLDRVAYLTNETVFDITERPRHLLVLGGGPIGCELAQAFRRLGSSVSIVEMASLLPKDDPELVDVVRQRLRDEGVALFEGRKVGAVEPIEGGIALLARGDGGTDRIEGSHLLAAAGRRANFADLGLAAAGIAHDAQSIKVDARLRTSNRRVYAIGDAVGGLQFTHLAGYHAGIVIRNALFRWPARVDDRALPWATYTEPELAQVGLSEAAARAAGRRVEVLRWPFAANDRAQAERATEGLVKAVVTPRGRILGAAVVGPQAGELIQPWVLAIASGLKIGALATMIAPYPTRGEAGKRAAGSFYTPKLFGPRTRALVRFLRRFG